VHERKKQKGGRRKDRKYSMKERKKKSKAEGGKDERRESIKELKKKE
jgi:hypothetical protein